MSIEQEKMIVESLPSLYPLQEFEERAIHTILDALPPIQPEITHEQAVEYLQSTGWMREHDLQMMLDGVHRLTAQPEIVRCKDCKYAEYIDDVQTLWCTECGQGRTVAPYDFCSYAERREVTT